MIATVTFNPAVDHTTILDTALEPDTVMRTGDQRFDAAGKGINVSKYLDALGAGTAAVAPVGGFTGRFIRDALAEVGVPHDLVDIPGTTRLNTTVTAADGAYKVNHAGARLDADAISRVRDAVERHDPGTVVVAGSRPPGVAPGDIDALASGPWRTVVDVDGETLAALDGEYALCKPNRAELAAATGMPTGTIDEAVAAARELQGRGFERVVASLGADGAVLVSPDAVCRAARLDVDVVDTVGAGDAVVAGILAAYADENSDAEALRTGVALAARVVGTRGTRAPDLSGFAADVDRVGVETLS